MCACVRRLCRAHTGTPWLTRRRIRFIPPLSHRLRQLEARIPELEARLAKQTRARRDRLEAIPKTGGDAGDAGDAKAVPGQGASVVLTPEQRAEMEQLKSWLKLFPSAAPPPVAAAGVEAGADARADAAVPTAGAGGAAGAGAGQAAAPNARNQPRPTLTGPLYEAFPTSVLQGVDLSCGSQLLSRRKVEVKFDDIIMVESVLSRYARLPGRVSLPLLTTFPAAVSLVSGPHSLSKPGARLRSSTAGSLSLSGPTASTT